MALAKRSLPFLLFLILTVGMTHPVAFHLEDSVFIDWDDTIYCVWALAWNFHKLATGLEDTFDANIFYPYENTLAFNENLIGQALLAYPLYVLTANPVLCHQVVFLLTFFLSAAGAYLLVLRLTGNRPAGFVAGIAFAFCQYRFGNIHLIIELSTQWIPFCLLYMHKFIENLRMRDLLLCVLFYLLNFLSCLYYGVILSLFLAPAMLYLSHKGQALGSFKFWGGAALFVALSGAVLLPVLEPYTESQGTVREEVSVVDAVAFSPDLLDLLAPSSFQWVLRAVTNRVSGFQEEEMNSLQRGLTRFLRRFHRHECHLYVGLTVTLLAWAGLRRSAGKARGAPAITPASGIKRRRVFSFREGLALALTGLAAFLAWLASKTLLTFLAVFFLLTAGLVLYRRNPSARERLKGFLECLEPAHRLYLFIALWAFAFTFGPILFLLQRPVFFGPWLPVSLIPGLGLMRHTFRMEAVAMLAMSVLAGYGVRRIVEDRFERGRGIFVLSVLTVGILGENLSAPLPLTRLETGDRIPAVYEWIRENVEEEAIVEFPFFADEQVTVAHIPKPWQWIWRVPFLDQLRGLGSPHDAGVFNWVRESVANSHAQYFSIFHWSRIVNGYSAFQPEIYRFVRARMESFPSETSLAALQAVGARYLVVHRAFCPAEDLERFDRAIEDGLPGLRRIGTFGDDVLCEILGNRLGGGGAKEDVAFRLHVPEKVGRGRRTTVRVGFTNSARLPLILYPSRGLNLHVRVHGPGPSSPDLEERVRITVPQVLNERSETLVPFSITAPPQEGVHRVSVAFEDPFSGRSVRLEQDVCVEERVPRKRMKPVVRVYEQILRATAHRRSFY